MLFSGDLIEINKEGQVGIIYTKEIEIYLMFREVKPVISPFFNDYINLHFTPTKSNKFGEVWVLHKMVNSNNEEILHLGVAELPLSHRRILIHKGNFPSDSSGCFLLGKSYEKERLWDSSGAMAQLIEITQYQDFILKVNGTWKF